jgi:hypothetical protein
MGLLHGIDTLSLKGRRSSNASADDRAPDGNPNDTSTLDKEEGNILMALISQRMCTRRALLGLPG